MYYENSDSEEDMDYEQMGGMFKTTGTSKFSKDPKLDITSDQDITKKGLSNNYYSNIKTDVLLSNINNNSYIENCNVTIIIKNKHNTDQNSIFFYIKS